MRWQFAKRLPVAMLCLGAAGNAVGAVTAEEAWVRTTVPGQSVAAGYLKLRSTDAAALVGIRTPVTPEAAVHEMSMQGGIMKMRPIKRLTLPAGRLVELKPGGYHVMLTNLTKPLKEGEKVPLTLTIERQDKGREEIEITAEVRSAAPGGSVHEHHR